MLENLLLPIPAVCVTPSRVFSSSPPSDSTPARKQPAYRRERQDKVQAPLLFENRFNRLYREDDWQRAKDAQQSKTPYE
jgi:hypothetical protein